jgi:hypothetical protein
MQPAISTEPPEARILLGIVAKLKAASGPSYIYDAQDAYLVQQIQMKLLAESEAPLSGWAKTLYYVQPGDFTVTPDTACKMNFVGDCLVTAATRTGWPELPWVQGYIPTPVVQMRMWADLYRALNAHEIDGATLFVTNRNTDIDVDGWALVQSQIGFEYTEMVGGE